MNYQAILDTLVKQAQDEHLQALCAYRELIRDDSRWPAAEARVKEASTKLSLLRGFADDFRTLAAEKVAA